MVLTYLVRVLSIPKAAELLQGDCEGWRWRIALCTTTSRVSSVQGFPVSFPLLEPPCRLDAVSAAAGADTGLQFPWHAALWTAGWHCRDFRQERAGYAPPLHARSICQGFHHRQAPHRASAGCSSWQPQCTCRYHRSPGQRSTFANPGRSLSLSAPFLAQRPYVAMHAAVCNSRLPAKARQGQAHVHTP